MFNANKGYNGYSMSNRAVIAYDNGEKPWSKWNKKELIQDILTINSNLDENLLKKINLLNLKNEFLEYSSWHHTSKFYNITNFYSLNLEWIKSTDNNDLKRIIDNQNAAKQKIIEIPPEDLQALMLYKKYTAYKTEAGFIRAIKSGKYTLEELQKLKQKQEAKDAKKQQEYLLSLIEFSKYKTKNAYLNAIKSGKLDIKTLEKAKNIKIATKNVKSISSTIDHIKVYLQHVENVEKIKNHNSTIYLKSKNYIENNFKYDDNIKGKNSLEIKSYITRLEAEKIKLTEDLNRLNNI